MQITVNSNAIDIGASCTISELIEQLGLDAKRIAIEHNRTILSPEQFSTITLSADDCIEIVNFVGGG